MEILSIKPKGKPKEVKFDEVMSYNGTWNKSILDYRDHEVREIRNDAPHVDWIYFIAQNAEGIHTLLRRKQS